MNCSICNRDIPAGAKFCPGCGTLVSPPASSASPASSPFSQVPDPGIEPYNPVVATPPAEGIPPTEPAVAYSTEVYSEPYYEYKASSPQDGGSDPYNIPPVQNYADNGYAPSYSPPAYSTPSYNPPAYNPPYGPPPLPGYVPPTPQPASRTKTWLIVGGVVLVALLVLCGSSTYLLFRGIGNGMNQYRADIEATATARSTYQNTYDTPTVQPTVQDTPTVQPTVQDVVTPDTNPVYGKGTLVLNDPLRDNTQGYNWDENTMPSKTDSSDVSMCAFKGGAYQLSRTVKGGLVCNPESPQLVLNNLAFETKATILSGNAAGLVVRFTQTTGKGYLFSIFTSGSYSLDAIDFNSTDVNQEYTMLHSGKSSAIHQGLGQTNLLAISANGGTLNLYVNDQLVDTVQDSSLTSGQIGIYGSSSVGPMAVSATNARAWKM